MRNLLFIFLLFTCSINAQDYKVFGDSLRVIIDSSVLEEGKVRVEYFKSPYHGFLGMMQSDTMYFELPFQDTFDVRSRIFKEIEQNGCPKIFWYWLHNPININIEEDLIPINPVEVEFTDNYLYATGGLVYVVERFGNQVFYEEFNGIDPIYINPNLFVSGFYYVIYWSPSFTKTFTIYK